MNNCVVTSETRSLCYSRSTLHRLRQGTGYPPPTVIGHLKTLGLFRNRSRRQGKDRRKKISVVTSVQKQKTSKEVKPRKLVQVPRLWYDLPSLFMSIVTSLANKFDELVATIKMNNCDVVAVTEAWQIIPEICRIENYDMFHQLRRDRRGGGVALFTRGKYNA